MQLPLRSCIMRLMIRRTMFALLAALLATGLAAGDGRIVILLGPPASGRTTQAAFLHKQYGLPVISADELIQANPQAFAKLKEFRVNDLEPHSDPILNKLVQEKLKTVDLAKGVIFDGYPNTKDHADFLAALSRELGLVDQATVIQLEVPDSVVLKRAKGDRTVEQQLKDYRREMGFVQVYFPNARIRQVDATKKPATVSKAIVSILEKP